VEAQKIFIALIVTLLCIHVLYVDYSGVAALFQTGVLAKRLPGLTEGPDKSSYLSNLLMALLLAELLFRVTFKQRLLALPNAILGLLFVLTLFSSYLEDVRNGVISLTLLLLLTFLLYARARLAKLGRVTFAANTVLALALIGVVLFAYVKSESRWRTLLETIPIALDTTTHKAWLMDDKNRPPLASGKLVDPSNYLRIAFAKEGFLLVQDHPLGIGFGRNAFAHGIHAKYGYGYVGHSHSGFIDLAIGAGVPGVLLWLGWMATWFRFGLTRYFRHASFAGLALALLVFEFNARMVLDSISRDHSLQQFLFLAGLLTAFALSETKAAASTATAHAT
jgi:O-antigen ligase